MREEQPTMSVRVDYSLTSAQLAHALLNSIFAPDGHPHTLSPQGTMTVVLSFGRKEIQQAVRRQLMWYGQYAEHWRAAVKDDVLWGAAAFDAVHAATVVHVERVFSGMIQWQTYQTHPASGLTLELFPLDDPRWARVTTKHRDGTQTRHTRTSDVDSAYRLFGKLYAEYMSTHGDDEN